MFHMWDIPLGMGWWGIFGGAWMIILWGGIIAFIVWGIKKANRPRWHQLKEWPIGCRQRTLCEGRYIQRRV